MPKIMKMLKLTCLFFIIFGFNPVIANGFDLKKSNEYLSQVDKAIAENAKDYATLNNMYVELEKLNYQAEQLIQEEIKKLNSINEMEKDTGITDELNANAADVRYLEKKKKNYATKLSQYRLFVFKSQDRMSDLQELIYNASSSRVLTHGEKVIDIMSGKQTALYTIGFLLLFILALGAGYVFFLKDKIKTLHLRRVTKLFEVKLLKVTISILIIGWVLLFALQWSSVSSVTLNKTQDLLVHGTEIYGVRVIPLQLLFALMVFSIIQIVGKYIAMRVSNQAKFEDEEETQIVIDKLIKYIVFAIALVSALLITGVDFTGLAIVAGALSVGIGFGLQNIVNNFVSGLILLIERPVRPGDRISVKGIEGYVDEINIRSTTMVSFLKEEIIIPNSDLISNPITNFVLHNTLSRMTCKVCVTYDSDVGLVSKTLLKVADNHPDILQDKENPPSVVLLELNANGMLFELGCIVKHVDKKYTINSEVNILIIEQFRKNNIKIAIPQLEVHAEHLK